MKYLTLALGLSVLGASLPAQQQSMPGMDMPAPAAPPQTKSRTNPTTKPNRTKQQPDPMPQDMKGMGQDTANRGAKAGNTPPPEPPRSATAPPSCHAPAAPTSWRS